MNKTSSKLNKKHLNVLILSKYFLNLRRNALGQIIFQLEENLPRLPEPREIQPQDRICEAQHYRTNGLKRGQSRKKIEEKN